MANVFVIRYLTKKKKCPLYVLISEKYFKYASFTTREKLPEMKTHSMDVWNYRVIKNVNSLRFLRTFKSRGCYFKTVSCSVEVVTSADHFSTLWKSAYYVTLISLLQEIVKKILK